MRCKNCGTDNDDNRYICETCGSPLYDEEEINSPDAETTLPPQYDRAEAERKAPSGRVPDNNSDREQTKKSVITIAVLVVILVAIIASVAVIASTKARNAENQTTADITTSDEYTTEDSFTPTERTTQEKTTEKKTTEKETTTKPTTQAVKWIINASSSGGGEVKGAGEYENGKKVTLIAVPDNEYQFDGWYSNGVKVSSSAKYTFKANENASFSAVFNPIDVVENTEGESTSSDDTEVMFGDND